MPRLHDMIGGIIHGMVPMLSKSEIIKLKLYAVDAGGIWVESQDFVNSLLASMNLSAIPKTPVFFLPYHQITFLVSMEDAPALSEKSFGATD